MLFSQVLALAALFLPGLVAQEVPVNEAQTLQKPAGFAKPVGTNFALAGGTPERFAGMNTWYLTKQTQSDEGNVTGTLQLMKEAGVRVVRVWGFRIITSEPGEGEVWLQRFYSSGAREPRYETNIDPVTGLGRLDFVLRAAEELDMKVIVVLSNWFSGDEVNPIGEGGAQVYADAFGGDVKTWFEDPQSLAQLAYKDHVRTVVERYKDNSTVFGWELMNEPRCEECPTTKITNWANDISTYIREILQDKHMISVGDEGWFNVSANPIPPPPEGNPADPPWNISVALADKGAAAQEAAARLPYEGYWGIDTIALMKLKNIDFGKFHLYDARFGLNALWGPLCVAQHARVARDPLINKPVIAEEYGSANDFRAPTTDRQTIVDPWQKAMVADTIAADFYWQFGSHLLSGSSTEPDTATIFDNDADYPLLVTAHANEMSTPALPLVRRDKQGGFVKKRLDIK